MDYLHLDFAKILFYIFVTIGSINFLHLGMYLVGGDMYDIREFRRTARLRHNAKIGKKPKAYKPLVSIIVPAHNEELSIEHCLDSIRLSSYKNIEIIVHNDISTDKTAKILAGYKKQYKNLKLRVINRRKRAGKGGGVNYALQKFAKGELVMTLDADCILHVDAIKNAVKYFKDDRILGVAANVRVMESHSILVLLQRFEHLIGYRSKKFYTMTNSEFIVGGVASTYRRNIMKEVGYYDTDTQTEDIGLSMKIVARGNREQRIIYAADVLAMTKGVQTFKALLIQRYRWKLGMFQNLIKQKHLFWSLDRRYSKMLTIYRIPMAYIGELMLLLEPFVLGYIIYLSIHYGTTLLFFGAYATITAYVLLTVWPDEHLTFRRKMAMSIYAPIMYFVFYIMDVVQIIAIFRVMLNPRKVLMKGKTVGYWTSPKRSVQTADFAKS